MKSRYPFDPYDWATITPLYAALTEAPLSSDDFMDWLAAWNRLDISVHDAWTWLKRPAYYDTRDQAAERAYQTFTEHMFSTYLGISNTLITRALAVQVEPPALEFQQLWRRWHNQAMLFDPASLELQAEISRLEGSYREIMRRYEGSSDAPFAYWVERRAELNELMLRLLSLRRRLARTSGMDTFLVYRWRELNRLDYSIEDCQAFHRAVERVVVPAVMHLRSLTTGETSIPEIADPAVLVAGIERILGNVDATFGDLFHRMRDGYLDLGYRPGKADACEAWFFPGTGMPYLHVAGTGPPTVLHESGHGLHDYLSFQAQRYLWNVSGPEEFQEFAAIGLDMLCWSHYEQSHGGLYTADERAAARRGVLWFYLEEMANSVLQDAFEHWVYGEAPDDVTPADLDAKWFELRQRFMPWNTFASDEEAMTGWQRWKWSLFRMPLYMITYPTAIVATCQLARLIEANWTSAIRNYTSALSLGNTRPLPELFRIAGVTFPFTSQTVTEAVDFVLDQWASIPNG